MADTMSAQEVAGYLRIHVDNVCARAASGELAAAKMGKEWVFYRPHIESYLLKIIAGETARRSKNHLRPVRQEGNRMTSPTTSG